MTLITDRYAKERTGMLTCYDRMISQGYAAPWSHAEGMTSYLNAEGIRIKQCDGSQSQKPICTNLSLATAGLFQEENYDM